jgi:hypothetical protein
MAFKIKSPENFWSGALFFGFGLAALLLSREYPTGTAMQMGPGYFPTLLGGLLVALGVIIAATSVKIAGEGIKPFAWRPLFLLSAAFAFFGWGIENLGFIPSLTVLCLLSAAAGSDFNWKETVIMTALLVAGSWALFIWGLEVQFQLFWWR